VIDVKEKGWHGKEDKFLLEQAYADERFILTHDSDFGTLAIFQSKEYYGIIYLRLKDLHYRNIIRVCENLLQLKQEVSIRSFVVEEGRVRIRQE
jgi:predicted nuclease of predicted toxin-antitoxin system